MQLPAVGDRLPQQGNRFTRALGRTILRLMGWRVDGAIPNREKLLAIAAPHTSGWDFTIAMFALLGIGIRLSWLGVDWLVRYPFMRMIGGIPVDRSSRAGMVPQAIEKFRHRERFVLGLSPEGSRKKVVPWKTGFYHIAVGAGVPILLVSLDQDNKRIHIGPWFEPSGDYEADMATQIKPFYAEFAERYSDRFGF
ncbi:MAG: lysophospholipid acyltransferase family protein [Acidobacteriota bacterium]